MDLGISHRVALVTGSSSGLGLATARALAAEGCRVALNGRDAGRLERAAETLGSERGDRVATFRADVSVPAEADGLVRDVEQHFGAVDILVCNAAGPPAARFTSLAAGSWRRALELNLLSAMQLCAAAVPGMQARRWGRIICLTSIAAKQPVAGLILSTTARAGVLGFAKSLSDELAAQGITVNAVCPGFMRTERLEDLAQQRAAHAGGSRDVELAGMVRDVPAQRIGEPAELAAAIAFLASERAAYITGVALQVDGGFIRSVG
ncbi:MAG TPA: SDR family oxidoreductase [Gemmatimonadales bacterium]|nr:SDR family oxidoreductase [Gemmatimonadales bacterium]